MPYRAQWARSIPLPPPLNAQEQEGDEELPEFPDAVLEADTAQPQVVVVPTGDPIEQVKAVVYPSLTVDADYPAG